MAKAKPKKQGTAKKQILPTATFNLTRKNGYKGKMVPNQFDGYNNPPKRKSRINSYDDVQATIGIVSGGDSGAIVDSNPPDWNTDPPIIVDPTISDPLGLHSDPLVANGSITSQTPTTPELTSSKPDYVKSIKTQDITIGIIIAIVVGLLLYSVFKKK